MTANYDPRRNIVHRPDGRPVNVARSRGQLFVCADACCCGRVEDGMAPVPRDVYHAEWERRRLRNIVHLTVGGCLGPCALANVALLILDGRASWFHSVNAVETVTAIYDYIEAMLDADRHLAPPEPLAALLFTASTWEPRADGLPLADGDRWQRRKANLTPRPPSLAGKGVPTPTSDASATADSANRASSSAAVRPGTPFPAREGGRGVRSDPPRKNGELVFEEPWQGRAFGMAVALNEDACYAWDDFRERLIAQIAEGDAQDNPADPSGYYQRWLAAFERLLAEKGMISTEELDERTAEIEFGERDDVF